jgi:hypothetical protein
MLPLPGQHTFTAAMEMQEGEAFIISFFQVRGRCVTTGARYAFICCNVITAVSSYESYELTNERQRQYKVSMNHEQLLSSCTDAELAVVDVQHLTDVQQ